MARWTKKWDDVVKSSYLTFAQPAGPQKCAYLSFADEQGIGEHAAHVKSKGLGAAIVWTIDEGHPSTGTDRDPLWSALWNGLR